MLATTLILLATTAYPPCTPQRTDSCQERAPAATQWPTLYIPCPKGEYCPPYDIPHHKTHPHGTYD